MKTLLTLTTLFLSFKAFSLTTGSMAPDFTLQNFNLKDFRGKTVVLEWLNHGCPFVRKHYDSGNMQALQKKYTAQGIVWASVISSAPGKQGHVDEKGAMQEKEKYKSAASHILLDPTGKVGMLYEAKTTPHMYIINPEGKIVYQGAIDDKPDTDLKSIKGARNFVSLALDAVKEGKPVPVATTKAYGCSVKYP